jgi:preprotein translocase subunit SecF
MMRLLKLVPDNTNLDFLRWRTIAFLISSLLIAGSIALLFTRGLNFGIDFEGGQMIRATFVEPPRVEVLRRHVAQAGHPEATVQEFGSPRDISIRMALPDGGEEAANLAASNVRQSIETAYPGVRFDAVETVSGQVSSELVRAGALALLFAMIGVSIYIWFRFEWQFGFASLFSLFHDVTITLGFLSLTQLEFDLNVIAALLTLIGYSLNDNIVIFDRIRENLRKYRKMEISALINLSLNETLARTVATNMSMLLALGALFFLGPDVIFSFNAALLISVIVGTYSTMYVAAPWLIWLKVTPDSFLPKDPVSRSKAGPRNEGYDGAQV